MEFVHPFIRYALVGILNTAVHAAVFAWCVRIVKLRMVTGNTLAFLVAVTVSFLINSLWTFGKAPTLASYVLFAGFMGLWAAAIGKVGDKIQLPPALVFTSFTATSLVVGFLFSKLVVFKG
jgi:putative flippase GtrA